MTLVIAHCGAWKKAALPQNSIASLRRAIALGCGGSEFDVRLTADGVPVVNHDADFYGAAIDHSTYVQLSEVGNSNGKRLATLEEYLRTGLQAPEMKLILEIKSSPLGSERNRELVEKTVAKVHALDARQVEYISFEMEMLRAVRALDDAAHVSYLAGDKPPAQIKAEGFNGIDYSHSVFQLHPAWIAQARELGLTTNVWTVNDAANMRRLLDAGADYITTDEPELLQEISAQAK